MACFPIAGDAQLSPDGRTLLFTTGGERLAQRLRVGFKTIQGTYKYDLSKGIPWFVLFDKPNRALLPSAIRDYFLSHPEVHSIISLAFRTDRTTRVLSCTYELRMKNGETITATTPITPLA